MGLKIVGCWLLLMIADAVSGLLFVDFLWSFVVLSLSL